MEVTVSTSRGRQTLALDPSWTLAQLKEELHTRLAALSVPEPSFQKLVCATKGYAELDAQDGGSGAPLSSLFSSGDCLVVIPRRDVATAVATATAPLQTTPAPTAAEINEAISLENERLAALGAPPPPPPPPRPASRDPGFRLDDIQQLRGYLEQLREAMEVQGLDPEDAMMAIPGLLEGLAEVRGVPGMPGGEDDEEEEDGDEEGREGAGGEPVPPAPVIIPEPEAAALTELLAMGFPDQLSRNALLLHRNRLQPAVDWALSNVDDPSAAEPLAEERLQEIYARPSGAAAARAPRPRLPAGQIDAAALDAMVEMGFSRDASARALAVTRNRLEAACQLVLSEAHLPPVPEGAMPRAAAAGEGAGGEGNAREGGAAAAAAAPLAAAPAPAAAEGMAVDAADVAAAMAAAMADEHASDSESSEDSEGDGDSSDGDGIGAISDDEGWHTDNGSEGMEDTDDNDDEDDDDEDPEGADVDIMDHEAGGAFYPLGMMMDGGGGGGDPADLEFTAAGQYVPEEMYSDDDYSDEYEEEGEEEDGGEEGPGEGGQGPQE